MEKQYKKRRRIQSFKYNPTWKLATPEYVLHNHQTHVQCFVTHIHKPSGLFYLLNIFWEKMLPKIIIFIFCQLKGADRMQGVTRL